MTLPTFSRAYLGAASLSTSVRRVWTRRNLTAEERANLLSTYTPPTIVASALGGLLHVGEAQPYPPKRIPLCPMAAGLRGATTYEPRRGPEHLEVVLGRFVEGDE